MASELKFTPLGLAGAVAAGAALWVPAPGLAAERWQVAMVATSDYVRRGISLSNGDPAVQAGAIFRLESGPYASLWASTVSNARTALPRAAGRYELSYVAGLALPVADRWDVDLAWQRYEYPDSDAPVDYGYTELSASLGYEDRLRLTVARSGDATVYTSQGLERDIRTYAIDLVGQYPLDARTTLMAGAGHIEFRDRGGSSYGYFSAGLLARLGRVHAELQYIDTSGGERLFGHRLAGPRLMLAFMVGWP